MKDQVFNKGYQILFLFPLKDIKLVKVWTYIYIYYFKGRLYLANTDVTYNIKLLLHTILTLLTLLILLTMLTLLMILTFFTLLILPTILKCGHATDNPILQVNLELKLKEFSECCQPRSPLIFFQSSEINILRSNPL